MLELEKFVFVFLLKKTKRFIDNLERQQEVGSKSKVEARLSQQ